MAVAALVGMLVMLCIVDVLVGVNLPFVLMGMDVLFSCMTTHSLSPPSFQSCTTYSSDFAYLILFVVNI